MPSNTLGDPVTEVIRRRLQAYAFPADAPERNAVPLQAGKLTAPADTGTSLSDTITNGQHSPSSHVVSVYHKSYKKARGYAKINGKICAPGADSFRRKNAVFQPFLQIMTLFDKIPKILNDWGQIGDEKFSCPHFFEDWGQSGDRLGIS